MKYFKKSDNSVWAFESDGSQDEYITDDMVAMTDAEVDQHINPQPTTDQLSTQARNKRDQLLSDTQWLVQRHRDQIEVAEPTTLTADQYKALLTYRQALRDVPTQSGFPDNIIFPKYPL